MLLMLGGALLLNVTPAHAVANVTETYDISISGWEDLGGTFSGSITATFPATANSFTAADITSVDLSMTGSNFEYQNLMTVNEYNPDDLGDTFGLDGDYNITSGTFNFEGSNFTILIDNGESNYYYATDPYASDFSSSDPSIVLAPAPEPTTLMLGGLGGLAMLVRFRRT